MKKDEVKVTKKKGIIMLKLKDKKSVETLYDTLAEELGEKDA